MRPIREQLEHDRVIRLLQLRLRRRFVVGINIGDEPEATAVRSGTGQVYPDLVLTAAGGPRRLHGVVEVETAESVNRLEAMHEWVHFGKVRGAFYLYVPAGAADLARRLCEAFSVSVSEIWSYRAVGDQLRFTMVHRSKRATRAAGSASSRTARGAREAAQRPSKARKKVRKTKAVKQKATKKATGAGSGKTRLKSKGVKASKKAAVVRSGAKKRGVTTAATAARGRVVGPRGAKKAVTKKSRTVPSRKPASSKNVRARSRKRR